MSRIVQLSEASSLALHAAVLLATAENGKKSVKDMASSLNASEAHLAKVVQQLAKAGLVTTTRGPKGGVALARPKDEISFLDIYEAIEGKLTPAKCIMHTKVPCPFTFCIYGDFLEDISRKIKEKFENTKLSDCAYPILQ